ncbi:MAG: ribonuclease P protein component [Spirochaetaceae bacterium]|jgi:ribonuclease P protein component|nr:ribonuclease P protein component [Spirochaetaceae bacterium]
MAADGAVYVKRMSMGILAARESSGKHYPFPRQERLKRREDIQAVFKRGASASCFGARLFFLHREGLGRRIAFTFARKFGNAVERNRARRLGKEAYRHLRSGIKSGYDFVLLVYPVKNNFRVEDSSSGDDLSGGRKSPNDLSFRIRQMRCLLSNAGLFTAEIGS